ncbi:MAG: ribonuclease P protein component [candidate division NC10 bacterium]|nr:ribonuclease P protein component [candidate division NC10 bacterium]MDE2320580.1 ribonuclease P protein component [candidate division NC10 bacterium]
MRQPESSGAARPRRAFNTNDFTLYARFASTKKQELRLAFGARTGTAIVRNRAKRLAREAFRLNRHQLPVGVEIVITAKKGISALSRRDMRGQFRDLFDYARRLSPPSSSDSVRASDTSEHC